MILLLLALSFAIEIPTGLSESDRDEVIRLLGVGTSSKFNSVPESLGGFSGVEVGISVESLPADKLNDLGAGATNDESFDYAKVTIGKGLFYHVDVFTHFIPFDEKTGLSAFGAHMRWQMATYFDERFSIATLAHLNSANLEDAFVSDAYGLQLHLAWDFDLLQTYVGYGTIRVKGKFKGGPTAITDSGLEVTQKLTEDLYIGGLSFQIQNVFLSFEINKSEYTALAAKIGIRF